MKQYEDKWRLPFLCAMFRVCRYITIHVLYFLYNRRLKSDEGLKGLFHPAFLARVVSWFPFVVAIFMGHENGGKQRLAKRRHVQGMLDETDPLSPKRIVLQPLGFVPYSTLSYVLIVYCSRKHKQIPFSF